MKKSLLHQAISLDAEVQKALKDFEECEEIYIQEGKNFFTLENSAATIEENTKNYSRIREFDRTEEYRLLYDTLRDYRKVKYQELLKKFEAL